MNNKKNAQHKDKSKQVFVEHKRKKKWLHNEKTGHYGFMLYPRSLYITNIEYWDWKHFKDTSEDNIEVIKLKAVCWLDARGTLKLAELSAGVTYNVAYVVKLTESASGWELPMNFNLSVPGKVDKRRRFSLLNIPRGEWTELIIGSICPEDGQTAGEVGFQMYEYGGHWKTGLILKGVTIKPIG